jgi:hypothetical protein
VLAERLGSWTVTHLRTGMLDHICQGHCRATDLHSAVLASTGRCFTVHVPGFQLPLSAMVVIDSSHLKHVGARPQSGISNELSDETSGNDRIYLSIPVTFSFD